MRMESRDFAHWLAGNCPNLYRKIVADFAISLYYSSEDHVDMTPVFDDLQEQGFLWCINWELIRVGRPSLN